MILATHGDVVRIPAMDSAYVVLSSTKESCQQEGCFAAILIASQGFAYVSPGFAVDARTVVSSYQGFEGFNPFYFVSDVTFDLRKAVAFTISTNVTEAVVSYTNQAVSSPEPDFWTRLGGDDWGSVPLYLVGMSKRASYRTCN